MLYSLSDMRHPMSQIQTHGDTPNVKLGKHGQRPRVKAASNKANQHQYATHRGNYQGHQQTGLPKACIALPPRSHVGRLIPRIRLVASCHSDKKVF